MWYDRRFVLTASAVYVLGIAALHFAGISIWSVVLTLPGSYVVFSAADWVPTDSDLYRTLITWNGNLMMLLASALLNALAFCGAALALEQWKRVSGR